MTAEERAEWERDEEALRRDAQTGHAPALPATESAVRGSRVLPDHARVERYAELIGRLYLQTVGGGVYSIEDIARAVVAVADEEHAALVAEVERLRAWQEGHRVSMLNTCRALEAAEAERDRLRAERLSIQAQALRGYDAGDCSNNDHVCSCGTDTYVHAADCNLWLNTPTPPSRTWSTPTNLDGEFNDPDCTCGQPVGHRGDCR